MIATAAINPNRIVRSLIAVANGVTTSDYLAKLLGCSPGDLLEPLTELANDGRVLIWPAPKGRLGIMLSRTNRPKSKRASSHSQTGVNLDSLPDERSRPITAHDEHCYGMPYPWMILLGYRTHWPNPRWTRKSPCPGCGDQPLSVDSYCLVCDRWGRDGGTWGRRKGPEATRTRLPERNGLKGGRE